MLCLVIPTYNERENVRLLVDRIDRALAGLRYELFFVDDSADGTEEVIGAVAAARKDVRVFHRSGTRGLASAVVEGLARAEGEVLCILDADLQHPPETIPLMLRRLEESGADVVVASRYLPGGGSSGLNAVRALISRGATTLAQVLLPRARLTTDPLSGFFLFRRGVIEGVALRPVGFKILLEILVRGQVRRVVDLPYGFAPRRAGASKLSMRENWDYLRHLLRLIPAGRASRPTP